MRRITHEPIAGRSQLAAWLVKLSPWSLVSWMLLVTLAYLVSMFRSW